MVNLTKIDIAKVLCPKCGAEPNKPCKNKKKRNHFARMQAAQKLNSKKNKGARSMAYDLSLIHISEPTRQEAISYAVFCLKKKKKHIKK